MTEHNGGKKVAVSELWHGTRGLNPEQIWSTPDGIVINFANPGMWGRGIYFAVNASYSVNYAHRESNEENAPKGMFFVKVITGCSHYMKPDKNLKIEPEKTGGGRYDSVKGNTNGSDVYIIYNNAKCLPVYYVHF